MSVAAAILVMATSGFVPPTDIVTYFPGSYFTSRVREPLHSYVRVSWPGPDELLRQWREGELNEDQRVALLVGSAAFHDPVMLPAYSDGLRSTSQRLRQAAIFGYRDCIGDRIPRVDVAIDDDIVASHEEEMRWMSRTLERTSLVAVWLQSILVQEEASLPGYFGIKMTRSTADCLRAVAVLADVNDLDLLVDAFELASTIETRIGILRIVEPLTLSRFLEMPKGQRVGWGPYVFDNAISRMRTSIQRWQRNGCRVDGEMVLRDNLRAQGWEVEDPLGAEACGVWIEIVRGQHARWWSLAVRRLYACGGPSLELSPFDPDDRRQRIRDFLVDWYRERQAPTVGAP